MNKVLTALSHNPDTKSAVNEIFATINQKHDVFLGNISCVVFFASSMYDAEELTNEMNTLFPNISTFGCTTAGELAANHLATRSLVAMGFTKKVIEDVKIETITNLVNYQAELPQMVSNFEQHFGSSLNDLDRHKHFGLMLMDSMVYMEERLLDAFGEYTNIEITGGSAADDMKFTQGIIFANGRCYPAGAGVIAIFKSAVPFGIECYQHFSFSGITAEVTKADIDKRIIYELDGKPAALRYAEMLNVPVAEAHKHTITRPLAFDTGTRPLVRSIQNIPSNNTLEMFCGVREGATLALLESNDLLESSNMAIHDIKRKYKSISGIIVFNCVLRYIEVLQHKQEAEFAALWDDLPAIGFCSYGEYYIGFVNQTMTMLVLE